MSFDYGSDGSKFNLPNPLRLENLFLALGGAVLFLGGLILLLQVKNGLGGNERVHNAFLTVLLAVALLVGGVFLVGWAMRQLRFFFGRGRPASLAPEVQGGMQGKSPESDRLREHLRQQALNYQEPSGALSHLLHSLVPNLTFAPPPVRALALQEFKKAISLTLVLVVLGLALIGGKTDSRGWSSVMDWIGAGFLFYVLWLLLTPVGGLMGLPLRRAEDALRPSRFVALVVGAVIGPVLLLKSVDSMPALTWLSPFPQIFILLALGLVSCGLFFLALYRNVKEPPHTVVSQVQDAWSINCHPGLVLEEFARVMQQGWQEKTPNRVYSRLEPRIDLNEKAGKFYAEALEETQPVPLEPLAMTFGRALQTPRLQPLLWLDALALTGVVIGTALLVMAGIHLLWTPLRQFSGDFLTYGVVFLALSVYNYAAAHSLWRRFEFRSQLVGIEMSGHYVTARLDHGNLMRDSLKTNSHVVQIESMTFRLWLSDLASVTFDNDGERFILSMAGAQERAEQLVAHFRRFAQEQAIILAPRAEADQQRHGVLGQYNQTGAAPEPARIGSDEDSARRLAVLQPEAEPEPAAQPPATPLAEASPPAPDEPPVARGRYCPRCGSAVAGDAAYCVECGARLFDA